MGRPLQVELLLSGVRDTSGNVLSAGKVWTYDAGTTTPRTTWTAFDKSSSAANPIILDSAGRAQVYADGAYKFVIKDSADNTLYTYDNLEFFFPEDQAQWGSTSGGSANAQTIAPSPAINAYVAGQKFRFIAGFSNSDACTLNVNSKGATTIKKGSSYTDLVSGDILSGALVEVTYDSGGGGRFILSNFNSISQYWGGTSSGAANVYAITPSPAITAYADGQRFTFLTHQANSSTTPTLNVNSLGAITLYKADGSACETTEIKSGQMLEVVYSSAKFYILNSDLLIPRIGQSNGSTLINTTSATYVDYTGASVTVTVPYSGAVMVMATVSCSEYSAADQISFRIIEDGSQIGQDFLAYDAKTSLGGSTINVTLFAYSAPSAASHTYKIQWKTTAGTAYSIRYSLNVLTFRS